MLLGALVWLAFPARFMLAHSRFWMQGLQFLLATIVGLEYEVRGSATRPRRPAIYAFKHQSAWETLATHLLVPGAAIVLKRELTQIPLFGRCLLHGGMIRIDRRGGSRALRGLIDGGRAALARGASIVICFSNCWSPSSRPRWMCSAVSRARLVSAWRNTTCAATTSTPMRSMRLPARRRR